MRERKEMGKSPTSLFEVEGLREERERAKHVPMVFIGGGGNVEQCQNPNLSGTREGESDWKVRQLMVGSGGL